MKTKLKKLSDSRVEITVTLDAKDLAPFVEQGVKELAKEVRVQGFRKGKAPIEIAKKFIPENDLNSRVLSIAVNETVVEAFSENEKMPLVMPNVNLMKFVPGETLEYTATADIVPEVKLADYKKLGVKTTAPKITAKDVDGMLENLAGSFAEKKVTKEAAKLGDEVVIDFVGKKDGEAFQGGTSKDFRLTLGSGTLIPGFEDGIVGHKKGDEFNLDLTFPEDYGMKDLAGAKTVFEVKLKQVNEVIKAPIDDELAKKCGPFKDLKELKEDIKKQLTTRSEVEHERKLKDELVEALLKKSKVPAPEVMIDNQMQSIQGDMELNAQSYGLGSFDEYLELMGQTREEWEEEAHEVAEKRVQASLALQKIAVDEGLTVSDAEVEAKVAELRDVYQKSKEALENLKRPEVKIDIKNRMIIEKALDFLVEANKK